MESITSYAGAGALPTVRANVSIDRRKLIFHCDCHATSLKQGGFNVGIGMFETAALSFEKFLKSGSSKLNQYPV